MSIKELESKFSNIGIKLKRKVKVSDEYEITLDDFAHGKIYQKCIKSDSIQRMVDGFMVMDDDIVYCRTSVNDIRIDTDKEFSSCGGKQLVDVIANYNIDTISLDGNVMATITGDCKVNALISLDNDLFTYEKPYLVNEKQNNGDSDIEVNITASFYHAGSKYKASERILQPIGSVSNWKVKEEPTSEIKLSLDRYDIVNKGGKIEASVERTFSRIYYMEDDCGNVVGSKSEPGLTEDITSECIITVSDDSAFHVNHNIITVDRQVPDSEIRKCIVTASYLGQTDEATITQEAGGKTVYRYDLSFVDEDTLYLDTCMPSVNIIELNSVKSKYIDNRYIESTVVDELSIDNKADWLKVSVNKYNDMCLLTINVIKANTDKLEDRKEAITIYHKDYPDKRIHLTVFQPHMKVKEVKYRCKFVKNGTYTTNELANNKKLYFTKPYKEIIYENGDIEEMPIEENLSYKYVFDSSDNSIYSSLIKDGDNYYLLFNKPEIEKGKYITVESYIEFYDKNGYKLFVSDTANISIKQSNNILLTVFAYANEKPEKETWSNEGLLIIDFRQEIRLKPFWLSPMMIENEYKDIIYQGYVELEEGRHVYEIKDLMINGKEYKYTGEIIVDEKMKETNIGIEI